MLIDRPAPAFRPEDAVRAEAFVPVGGEALRRAVNAAILLRRPLLVRGMSGLGKSTLALHLAHYFGLGAVLRWEVGSRSTLESALYHYDAVGHLQASRSRTKIELGRFVTLGPLGTALLPTCRPRVLLVDELDKASHDLPNDLLHVFEEGHFVLPELARLEEPQEVYPFDRVGPQDRVQIYNGFVAVHHHPVVVITSNDEREFTDAFLRRVVTLNLPSPTGDEMRAILRNWFGDEAPTLEAALSNIDHQRTAWMLQLAQLHLNGVPIREAVAALAGHEGAG